MKQQRKEHLFHVPALGAISILFFNPSRFCFLGHLFLCKNPLGFISWKMFEGVGFVVVYCLVVRLFGKKNFFGPQNVHAWFFWLFGFVVLFYFLLFLFFCCVFYITFHFLVLFATSSASYACFRFLGVGLLVVEFLWVVCFWPLGWTRPLYLLPSDIIGAFRPKHVGARVRG